MSKLLAWKRNQTVAWILTLSLCAGTSLGNASADGLPPAGLYSGIVQCTSDKRIDWIVKYRVNNKHRLTDQISDSYNSDDPFQVTPSSAMYYMYEDPYQICEGYDLYELDEPTGTITMSPTGRISIRATCKNWAGEVSPERCTGKLTRRDWTQNISLSQSHGKFSSKCFNIKSRTKLAYEFNDTGGFYAMFHLTARDCGSGDSNRLVNFSKWTNTASKSGTVNLPVGRYRFVGSSTDEWWAENYWTSK